MARAFAKIARDRRGVSAVEFAILAPVLLSLICGTIDLGYVFMAQTSLSGAVAAAARESAAQQQLDQDSRNASMRQYIIDTMNLYQPVSKGAVTVTSTVYASFGDVQPEDYKDNNANGKYDAGEPYTDRNGNGQWDAAAPLGNGVGTLGQVVKVTATYPVRHLFGFLANLVFREEGVTLTATSVVRNEPVKTV